MPYDREDTLFAIIGPSGHQSKGELNASNIESNPSRLIATTPGDMKKRSQAGGRLNQMRATVAVNFLGKVQPTLRQLGSWELCQHQRYTI